MYIFFFYFFVDVVLATTTGAGDYNLKQMNFDWVVIDEAAQGLEAACWIAIQKGKKVHPRCSHYYTHSFLSLFSNENF